MSRICHPCDTEWSGWDKAKFNFKKTSKISQNLKNMEIRLNFLIIMIESTFSSQNPTFVNQESLIPIFPHIFAK